MKWFNNLRVSFKVILSCFILLLFIAIISVQSITSVQSADEDFQTFYVDRFVPVRQLNLIFKGILQVRVNMLQEKIAAQLDNWDEFNKRIDSSEKIHEGNTKRWKEYMATKLTDEEGELAKAFERDYENMKKIAKEFVAALRRKDIAGSGEISDRWLVEYRNGRENMDKLIGLQQKIGEELKGQQERQAKSVFMISIAFLSASIFIGVVITFILSRSVSVPAMKGLEFAKQLADGDLTKRIDLDQKDELGNLGTALNSAADNLDNLISNVIIASQNLAQAVQQIASGNQNLSQRTSEQASSLEEVASTIEEATAAINQNAENAVKAKGQAEKSSNVAVEGGVLVEDAVKSINEINQTSKQIGEIISVINEIAFQTNLLALNAAVEAARAGEQGRGFAVVAGEVRNLAQRSGNAAKEIGDLIKNSIEKIEEGTVKANKSGESLTEIIESVKNVSGVISEIAEASNEQKQGIKQINIAIAEMDTMTQQNSALVEETASASEEMSNQASELLEMVQKFKISESYATVQNEQFKKRHQDIHITAAEVREEKKGHNNKSSIHKKMPGQNKKDNIKQTLHNEGFEEF